MAASLSKVLSASKKFFACANSIACRRISKKALDFSRCVSGSDETSNRSKQVNLLGRLDAGEVIIGDGGMIFELEKRCYATGDYTPECVIEYPDAVRGLHREFIRGGADVLQALTFYSSDDRLKEQGIKYSCADMNRAACQIAKEVAAESERPIMVAGCLSETSAYTHKADKAKVQAEFETQMDIFVENDVDFVIAESPYREETKPMGFHKAVATKYCEEICWAIETLKKCNKPVVSMMSIGGMGDRTSSLTTGECAVKMAEAGADVIGLNCAFDPQQLVEAMKEIKESLEKAGFKKHLICQPLGKWTPEAGKDGYISLPEFPFALEPRQVTRFEMGKFARDAYNVGIRYIGGCCAVLSYHIRAIAEELAPERGYLPPGSDKHQPWGGSFKTHPLPWVANRARRDYWENLAPASGRVNSPPISKSQFDQDFVNKKFKK